MKINEYRKTLDLKIPHNPTLASKELDIQFYKLIIELFLKLAEWDIDVQDKIVIINGLNKYNRDPAQSKIMELVVKSVIKYSDKILLL